MLSSSPEITESIHWVLVSFSAFPVILLILLMGVFKLSGEKSSLITLTVAIIIAVFVLDYDIPSIGGSLIYGSIKAITQIIVVIVAAIFSYNVLLHTGKMEVLKKQFSSVSSDKCIQVLLLTWGFGGLLEGMAGFGTAVAIPAAILISLGFKPMFSAVASLIANSVPTAFGAIGIPVIVLGQQTGLENNIQQLSSNIVIQLSPLMFIVPLVLVLMTDSSKKTLPKHLLLSFLVGLSSLVSQYITAVYMGAETPAIIGSIVAIAVIILFAKLTSTQEDKKMKSQYPSSSVKEILNAWSVYIGILFFIIITSSLFPFREVLATVLTNHFDFTIFDSLKNSVVTKTIAVNWLINAGLLIFLGAFIGGLIQGATFKELLKLLWSGISKQGKTIITICCLISLSSIMDFSGMVHHIGLALAIITGAFYPLIAPLIGGLGTFISGSDTSSNILFGKLQTTVGDKLGVNPDWMAAANTAGATGGKMISPQSIAVATSACDMQRQEGDILKKALPCAFMYLIIVGLVVYFLPQFV